MNDSIRFDGWTLLRSTGELMRGETRTRLQGQPLQVLAELLAHPGELVSREQLTARLWPSGVVVDFDTALNSAIHRLRTALDDHAEHPRYIETIPRRGYRFIGHIEPEIESRHLAPVVPADEPRAEALVTVRAAARSKRAWLAIGASVVAAALLAGWITQRSDGGRCHSGEHCGSGDRA